MRCRRSRSRVRSPRSFPRCLVFELRSRKCNPPSPPGSRRGRRRRSPSARIPRAIVESPSLTSRLPCEAESRVPARPRPRPRPATQLCPSTSLGANGSFDPDPGRDPRPRARPATQLCPSSLDRLGIARGKRKFRPRPYLDLDRGRSAAGTAAPHSSRPQGSTGEGVPAVQNQSWCMARVAATCRARRESSSAG